MELSQPRAPIMPILTNRFADMMSSPVVTPCHGSRTPTSRSGSGQLDRFIPNRRATDIEGVKLSLFCACSGGKEEGGLGGLESGESTPTLGVSSPLMREEYRKRLAEGLHFNSPVSRGQHRVLGFHRPGSRSTGDEFENSPLLSSRSECATPTRPAKSLLRSIPSAPERILDAPDLLDDYYLNLLHWGSSNVVAVALGPCVFLWNASNGGITKLMEVEQEDEYVTSVQWGPDGKHVAVGTSSAEVKIWDASTQRVVRVLEGHHARVSALAWNANVLSSGGRDSTIINHDTRQRLATIGTLSGHQQEVCGLRWSPTGNYLASGGNDNLLHVWDGPTRAQPLHQLNSHVAAVKALAWCPWQSNLLASGGGTADRSIKFWNASNGALLNSIDTDSQVCALEWNTHEREILSSHGFSKNQLCLWRYPTMMKVAELTGHTSRVLQLTQSPDGTTVCTAAGDETLRFWRCFADKPTPSKMKGSADSKLRSIHIR